MSDFKSLIGKTIIEVEKNLKKNYPNYIIQIYVKDYNDSMFYTKDYRWNTFRLLISKNIVIDILNG